MIKKIDHIAIAVENLEEQITFYRNVMGLEFLGTEEVREQQVKVAMFQVGEVRIELLEPTSEQSTVAKFLREKKQGIHHIAYEVDDIEQQIDHFQQHGVKMIHDTPQQGADESKIAFVHPKSTFRVLSELCQRGEQ